MLSIPKFSRRENSAETLAIIISIHEAGKLHVQIGDHLKLAKFTVMKGWVRDSGGEVARFFFFLEKCGNTGLVQALH